MENEGTLNYLMPQLDQPEPKFNRSIVFLVVFKHNFFVVFKHNMQCSPFQKMSSGKNIPTNGYITLLKRAKNKE